MARALAKPKMSKPTFKFKVNHSDEKLGELILYIAKKSQNDPHFGATKLNKILFFSDFYNYANHNAPITGVEYMRLGAGPVPKPLVPVRQKLIAKKAIAIQELAVADGYNQKKVVALREPDLSIFSAQEIEIVNMIMETLKDSNASEVSELSHGKAWQAAKDRESIPYEAFWISDEPISACDKSITLQLIQQGALGG
jgi:hypothetical protein